MTPKPPPLHFDLSEVAYVGGVTLGAFTPCHKGTYEECRQHAAHVLRRYRRGRLPVAMNCRGQSWKALDGRTVRALSIIAIYPY